MIKREDTGPALVIGGVAGIGSYFGVSALIKTSCSSRYLLPFETIDASSTGLLVSLAIAATVFVFALVTSSSGKADKFEKLVIIALSLVVVIWLSAIVIEGAVCSPDAWRRYTVYLIVPSLIAAISLIGRSWLNQDE